MFAELRDLMTDPRFDWDTRLVRLQGWRAEAADQAVQASWAQRIAPAVCSGGAFAGALLASPLVLGIFAATAVVGVVAPNHPVETLYNALAPAIGRARLPPNRASKRLGCLLGALHLTGGALAFALGAPGIALALTLSLGALAGFVAATGICVPSMLFTILFGAERASRPSLPAAWLPGRSQPA